MYHSTSNVVVSLDNSDLQALINAVYKRKGSSDPSTYMISIQKYNISIRSSSINLLIRWSRYSHTSSLSSISSRRYAIKHEEEVFSRLFTNIIEEQKLLDIAEARAKNALQEINILPEDILGNILQRGFMKAPAA